MTSAPLARRIDQGLGREPADLVVRNARILNTADRQHRPRRHRDLRRHHRRHLRQLPRAGARSTPAGGSWRRASSTPTSMSRARWSCRTTSSRACCRAAPRPRSATRTRSPTCWASPASAISWRRATRLAMTLRVNLSSCVPATELETAGARLEVADLLPLARPPGGPGPGRGDELPGRARQGPGACWPSSRPSPDAIVDGHAPLLGGRPLNGYLAAGIRTDHECTRLEEAREKLRQGHDRADARRLDRQERHGPGPAAQRPHLAAYRLLHRRPQPAGDRRGRPSRRRPCARRSAAGAPPVAVYRAASLGAARPSACAIAACWRRATVPTSCCSTTWRRWRSPPASAADGSSSPALRRAHHARPGRLRLGPASTDRGRRPRDPGLGRHRAGDRRRSVLPDHRPPHAGAEDPGRPARGRSRARHPQGLRARAARGATATSAAASCAASGRCAAPSPPASATTATT